KFGRIAARVQGQTPKITWLSTVSATPMQKSPAARYWRDHALNAVRFADAMRALDETGVSDVLEIGPGNTLLALGRQCVNESAKAWLGSLGKPRQVNAILASLRQLLRPGYDAGWDGFH